MVVPKSGAEENVGRAPSVFVLGVGIGAGVDPGIGRASSGVICDVVDGDIR